MFSGCPSVRPSVRPSVCPSVRPSQLTFWQCSCHRIILKFSGVITVDRRDVHAIGQSQRSKVKVTEVMTPFSRFRTVTPVWIHIWRWMMHTFWCCLAEVPYCFSRPSVKFQGHMAKKSLIFTQIGRFRTVTPVWIHHWLRNDAQSLEQHRKGAPLFFKVIRQFSRSRGAKNRQCWPELCVSGL